MADSYESRYPKKAVTAATTSGKRSGASATSYESRYPKRNATGAPEKQKEPTREKPSLRDKVVGAVADFIEPLVTGESPITPDARTAPASNRNLVAEMQALTPAQRKSLRDRGKQPAKIRAIGAEGMGREPPPPPKPKFTSAMHERIRDRGMQPNIYEEATEVAHNVGKGLVGAAQSLPGMGIQLLRTAGVPFPAPSEADLAEMEEMSHNPDLRGYERAASSIMHFLMGTAADPEGKSGASLSEYGVGERLKDLASMHPTVGMTRRLIEDPEFRVDVARDPLGFVAENPVETAFAVGLAPHLGKTALRPMKAGARFVTEGAKREKGPKGVSAADVKFGPDDVPIVQEAPAAEPAPPEPPGASPWAKTPGGSLRRGDYRVMDMGPGRATVSKRVIRPGKTPREQWVKVSEHPDVDTAIGVVDKQFADAQASSVRDLTTGRGPYTTVPIETPRASV